ncbi:AAA-like domain-containing protein [Lyngbya sp. CCY1209]|uniref:AAA-like domain-containing protein n=1 Tax=Lyngbya sp. CCY1209 TaxID=2886103 RepID=UPI002D211522|nr:AAA-like domain-containing protein [Lyngbya sp. CCY1209]MEB3884319.1 AAA-like domain-containing protein [Lyngbya sp. CCY1209]
MDLAAALKLVEQKLRRSLTPIERSIFSESWRGKTYGEISRQSSYGNDYVKEVGSRLWQELSEAVGAKITKKNVRLVLESPDTAEPTEPTEPTDPGGSEPTDPTHWERPGGPIPIDSPLYVDRPPTEEQGFAELRQPGCVIRIKAPRKMGKSSLLNRMLILADSWGYRTVSLNFLEADADTLNSLDRLLRWFCANAGQQLGRPSQLDELWDLDLGSKVSCRLYFEEYLLPDRDSPLVIALNEVNRVFEYPAIARDFLPMLRSWHEHSKQDQLWQHLRLIVVHSTEVYIPLQFHQSPFNVGLVLKLPEFTAEQVQDLALRHRLGWAGGAAGLKRLGPLISMVGGHPYLIQLAFYQMCRKRMSLEEVLRDALQPDGIYSSHLRELWVTLQQDPSLAIALDRLIESDRGVPLEAIAAYKLESMGLIHFDENLARVRCELYRIYFRQQFGKLSRSTAGEVGPEVGRHPLHHSSELDGLTQLANRHYFERLIRQEWQQTIDRSLPLFLMLCEVDYFQLYNDTHGDSAGDECLKKIAATLRECGGDRARSIARNGGARFALLFTDADVETVTDIAEKMCRDVKALAISYDISEFDGFVSRNISLSVGVASQIPTSNNSPERLFQAAEEALDRSKYRGGDRVTFYDSFRF